MKKTENGLYRSKIIASKKYDKKCDIIHIRVKKGYKEVIKDYSIKKGYNSVNSFIVDLVKNEIGSID